MNTYKKYCPTVFVAQTTTEHQRGDIIEIETKYGKVNEHVIHNLVKSSGGFFWYSITRADGFSSQERAKRKAEKFQDWAVSAANKSNEKWEESNEGSDFLTLAEPIKIGHHSERRHRALIERNHSRMSKSIELQDKAESHALKAEYWRSQEGKIDLSMPESIEFFEAKLEKAFALQKAYKDGTKEREHSYSLAYASKDVKELTKKLNIAKLLWGENN